MVICWIRSKRSLNLLNSKAVSTKTFEQVKLYFSIDRLFNSSFTVLASIELLTFRSVSAWISLQDVRIASQSGWWMRTASHPQRAFACGCSKGSQTGWGQGRLASTSRLSLLLCPEQPEMQRRSCTMPCSMGRCIILHWGEFVTVSQNLCMLSKGYTWLRPLLADITVLLGHGGPAPPTHSSTHLQPVLLVNLDEGWLNSRFMQNCSPLKEHQQLLVAV